MRRQSLRAVGALLACVLAAGPGAVVHADAVPGMLWTSVGSAGTVDEQDLGIVALDGAVAWHAGTAGQTVHVRYNVVAVDGVAGQGILLSGSFLDTGAASQVVLTLKRYNFETGFTEAVPVLGAREGLQLDSNKFAARAGFQKQWVSTCDSDFDFRHYAYFVDVVLSKTATSPPTVGGAALGGLQIQTTLC